jgi:hypothetical protein
MANISVPKPAKGSFDKDRKPSDLLKSQLKHFRELERHLPHRLQTGHNIEAITTEAGVSDYIKTVTARLHPRGKIKVPLPARTAFHKHRRLSDLLQKQLEHFREVEMRLPEGQRITKPGDPPITMEHEIADYIRKVTAALHAQDPARLPRVEAAPPATKPKTAGKTASAPVRSRVKKGARKKGGK